MDRRYYCSRGSDIVVCGGHLKQWGDGDSNQVGVSSVMVGLATILALIIEQSSEKSKTATSHGG